MTTEHPNPDATPGEVERTVKNLTATAEGLMAEAETRLAYARELMAKAEQIQNFFGVPEVYVGPADPIELDGARSWWDWLKRTKFGPDGN